MLNPFTFDYVSALAGLPIRDADLPPGVSQRDVDRAAADRYEDAAEPTFAQAVINMTPAMEKFLTIFEDDDGEDLVTELAQCAYAGPNKRLAFVERWVGKLEERWERQQNRRPAPQPEEDPERWDGQS